MKTAISLPDELFESADAYASRTGRSRSEVYAEALREYLALRDDDVVTERLNALCGELDARLPPDLDLAARRRLEQTEW
ncbi:MAG: ribbon-helix-helix protein, CopG family [Polyangia bacterium]|jgi:metal-responsive CopG/Arc/MetJ family transcriptional regulator|nr:ribbon-helix-helix protein, CopG family [Polyangia bacterium]